MKDVIRLVKSNKNNKLDAKDVDVFINDKHLDGITELSFYFDATSNDCSIKMRFNDMEYDNFKKLFDKNVRIFTAMSAFKGKFF